MLHPAHAATGALTGAALVAACDLGGLDIAPLTYPVYAVASAGWALAPDLDHDKSAFTRSGGPATRALAETLQLCARLTYRTTRRHCDPPTSSNSGEHRGLLHTLWFPLLVGGVVAWASSVHELIGFAVLAMVLSPAIRSLAWSTRRLGSSKDFRSRTTCSLAAFSAAAATYFFTNVPLSGPLFGGVAVLGMLTHIAGDGATTSGVPWFGGIPKRCTKHHPTQTGGQVRARSRNPAHQDHRRGYGKPRRRCTAWTTTHNVPKRWIRRTGHKRESAITGACLAGSAALVAAGAIGALG